MKLNTFKSLKFTLSILVLTLVSCHSENEELPLDDVNNEIIEANESVLASVEISPEAIVEFIDMGNGNTFIAVKQSMDAEIDKTLTQRLGELVASGNSAIDVYQEIAGKNVKTFEIDNLTKAFHRFEIYKERVKNEEASMPATNIELKSITTKRNTSNASSNGDCEDLNNNNFSRQWFLDNFVNDRTYTHNVNLPASYSIPVSLGDPDEFGIDQMRWVVCNANFKKPLVFNTNLTMPGQDPFTQTTNISPRRYYTFFYPAPFYGTFSFDLQSKASCNSTHIAVDLINTIR